VCGVASYSGWGSEFRNKYGESLRHYKAEHKAAKANGSDGWDVLMSAQSSINQPLQGEIRDRKYIIHNSIHNTIHTYNT
jgi:hypothetical protein